MSQRTKISALLKTEATGQEITVMGWVRSFRNNTFIALNDGSCIQNLQVVIDFNKIEESVLKRITTGACISAKGKFIPSQGKGQTAEINCEVFEILGDCDGEKY